MPRPAKGPRLHKFAHRPYWYIRDTGCPDQSTGCISRADAEKALAAYIATKGRSSVALAAHEITIAEILTIYAEEYAPTVAAPERIGYAIEALLPFWGPLKVAHVKGETCRRYAKTRRTTAGCPEGESRPVSPATVRRELGTLQAALNYCHHEGHVLSVPAVTLPEKTAPRERYLTRSEAARLIWDAYRGHKASHIARFILIGLYTGTRKDALLRMGFEPNTVGGWFDLSNGIMYRMAEGERTTNKRRSPAPIPRKLLAHLKRWRAAGARWAVEYQGARVGNIKRGFAKAAASAGLEDVTPHTLKHTAITWALQGGADKWHVAGFFSTSIETIERVYGHHAPDHMESARDALDGVSRAANRYK
ncbi:tyrosine-type recombinase/integrase [Rhodobacter maris]|uniref:Integrase n=1 Tax=Rhodobacter maris TaxID=446682 RepID=A0A285S0W2_9RHOB|nr:integrase [Rhodobacter maris]SOB98524.1 integrase [Rhodobacter maris]